MYSQVCIWNIILPNTDYLYSNRIFYEDKNNKTAFTGHKTSVFLPFVWNWLSVYCIAFLTLLPSIAEHNHNGGTMWLQLTTTVTHYGLGNLKTQTIQNASNYVAMTVNLTCTSKINSYGYFIWKLKDCIRYCLMYILTTKFSIKSYKLAQLILRFPPVVSSAGRH